MRDPFFLLSQNLVKNYRKFFPYCCVNTTDKKELCKICKALFYLIKD